MPDSEVLMDYAAVSQAAAKFETAAQDFNALIAPLTAIGQTLAEQSFVGSTGSGANTAMEAIQAQLQHLVQRCSEMSTDIRTSIQAFQTGDSGAADNFGG